MKRRELIKRISRAAKSSDLSWDLAREGAEHTLYRLGSKPVVIPRHNEINEVTAQAIMKDLEANLGKGWWR